MKLKDIIIEETNDWVALNKPSGLLSIPDREGKEVSLKQLLKEEYGEIFTVHRLDRDTSGVIIFAKNEMAHKFLSMQFEERQTEKIYLGLVLGSLPDAEGTITAPIAEHPGRKGMMMVHHKGKPARTDYKVIHDFRTHSWVQFQILTGRTHQIRVHAKEIGHPIVCDELYGDGKPVLVSSLKSSFNLSQKEEEEKPILGRLALHSSTLSFLFQDKIHTVAAELPRDLRATIQQLMKNRKPRT